MRITKSYITHLEDNQIFVFGSNEAGSHIGGAALTAYNKFNAKNGQGYGLQGRSFAIPTKNWELKTLPIKEIKFYVDKAIKFFKVYSKNEQGFHLLDFLVTEIGTGLAGYTCEEIAPLFKEALELDNVFLPQSFLDVLNK